MRVTIRNLVGSPYDVATLNGPAILPANGELTADFDPAQVDIWRGVPGVEVIEAEELPEPVIMREPVEMVGDGELETLRLLYAERFGKEPDKRWGERRIRSELAGD